MAVTLTYDDVLSRVRIAANALTAVSSATVERSTDQIRWATVRGAVDVPLTGGSLLLPGTAGNYASTPDNAALDIVGDIDLRADVSLDDWTPSPNWAALITKWGAAGQRSYRLQINDLGRIALVWSNDGTATLIVASTVAVVPNGLRKVVRVTFDVDNGAAGKTATFYTADTMVGPWTQLGAVVTTGGTTTIFSSTAPAEVGSIAGGTGDLFAGSVHAAEVRTGIAGTVVAVPSFEFLAAGTTSFTDGAGRVWTLNGTASIPTRQLVSQVDDYEFTPGVVNYYRVSSVDQPSGLLLPGLTGGSGSTPDNAALDIVADIDLRADLTTNIWNVGIGALVAIIAKYGNTANQRSYRLFFEVDGKLTFGWSENGTAAMASVQPTVVPTIPSSGRLAVRVTLDVNDGAANRVFKWYTAPSLAGPWTQLGATITVAGVTSIFSGSADMYVGASNVGLNDPLPGTVHAVEVRNGIDGTVVANPDFTAQPMGTTSFTDAAGRVWTVNRSMIIQYASANATPTLTAIWLKSVTRPFLNRPATVVGFTDPARPSRSSEFDVVGRSYPIAVNDIRSSRRWAVDLYTATADDAQTLDYVLAAGDVMLLHTPAGCEVPGGYVQIKDYGQRHPAGRVRGASRVTSLPLVEVAPPGPDVAANLVTWASVLAMYATWADLLAANPTWADVLQLVGDPSEAIVP